MWVGRSWVSVRLVEFVATVLAVALVVAALLGSEAGAVLLDALVLGAVAGAAGVGVHATTHLDELVATTEEISKAFSLFMIVTIRASTVVWIATSTIEEAFAVCL